MDYLLPLKSKLKLSILLCLLDGEKKLGDVKRFVESSETTILHVIKEFEGLNLTTKVEGSYRLTSLGVLEAQVCKAANENAEVIAKFQDFWLRHDLTGIPTHLMSRIGALKDSNLVRAELIELGNVHNAVIGILTTSQKLSGVSPIFHPDYVPIVEELLDKNVPVELIFTDRVLAKTLESTNMDMLKKKIVDNTLKIFINENLKFALTVTSKNFSFGLFETNGKYDYTTDLVSLNEDAILWGEELFNYILKKSQKIGPEDLTK